MPKPKKPTKPRAPRKPWQPTLCVQLRFFVELKLPREARSDYLATREVTPEIRAAIDHAKSRVSKALQRVRRLRPSPVIFHDDSAILATDRKAP